MSTVDRKVQSRFTEREVDAKSKLILSRKIIEQIEYLHDKVGNVEWSGILVYSIESGAIEDKNLVLKCTELLPMDIGSATYTEYEISPSSDDYTFDNLSRVMMDETLKIGHIHTHHNMGCFYSGTDQQELHDNAPNHNYYVSLIVNFKSYKEWCAKIAYIGEEAQKGVVTNWFKGTLGNMVERITNVDKTIKTLYTIKLDIECEDNNVEDVFIERIKELAKPKNVPSTYTPYGRFAHGSTTTLPNNGNSWQGVQRSMWEEWEDIRGSIKKPKDSVKIDVSKANLEKFLKSLLSDADANTPLSALLEGIETHLYPEYPNDEIDAQREIFLESIDLNLEGHFKKCFNNVTFDAKSLEVVADAIEKKILNIKKYKEYTVLYDIVNMFYVV